MKSIHFLSLLFLSGVLAAQPDAYHAQLTEWLGTQYTLSGETYPYGETGDELFSRFSSYGVANENVISVTGQDFEKAESLRVASARPNRWDAGWNATNKTALTLGEKVLWVVYARVNGPEDEGKVSFFAERNDNFNKEVEVTVDLNRQWKRLFIPFEITTRNQPVGGMTIGLHLGFQAQTVEIGGMAILQYPASIPLERLPNDVSSDEYGGFEADAEWRAPAATRIDALRKADLRVQVMSTDGSPADDARVEVRMQRHEFEFGTAVAATRFPGGRNFNPTFNDRIFNLDGRGHGFNTLVFENDLKWPGWEDEWVSTNAQTRRTIRSLAEQGITLRGHVLLWPGWNNMPERMRNNQNNPAYLKNEVDKHLFNFLETENFDQYVKDWDVLNEINTNTDLAAALRGTPGYTSGREFYVETIKRAKELAPDSKFFINDYITLSLKNTEGAIIYDQYKRFIGEILDGGAPLDGIGFQAHLGSSPNSIYEVLETYDDFYEDFGLEAKITELDMPPNVSEELGATYMVDFMTATFSHPSMTGIVTWNWWDVDTWANPGINLFNADWSRTKPGDAFVDLVFNQWWTDADLETNPNGVASVRGFKGDYTISVDCGNGNLTALASEVKLSADTTVVIDCAQLVSTQRVPLPAGSVTVSPNPASGPWSVTNALTQPLSAKLFDVNGRQLWEGRLLPGRMLLAVDVPAGVYSLRVSDGARFSSFQLVRR